MFFLKTCTNCFGVSEKSTSLKLGNLQLPRSYRRLKPSDCQCLLAGLRVSSSAKPSLLQKRHQLSMEVSPWAPLTCKPARHTQEELQTQSKFTKDYSYMYCLPFLLHNGNAEDNHNISCTCESKKAIKYHCTTACHSHSSWKKSR